MRLTLAGVAAAAVVTLVRAMVVAHLWQWFVADPFGAPRIGVETAGGLLLLLMMAAVFFRPADTDSTEITVRDVAHKAAVNVSLAVLNFLFALALVSWL